MTNLPFPWIAIRVRSWCISFTQIICTLCDYNCSSYDIPHFEHFVHDPEGGSSCVISFYVSKISSVLIENKLRLTRGLTIY